MNILFCLLHFGYERNRESLIRELVARGHSVHVAVELDGREEVARSVLESMARAYPRLTLGRLPGRENDRWKRLLRAIRLGSAYLRYLQPASRDMPGLRLRAEERVGVGLLRLLSWPGVRRPAGRRAVHGLLHWLEGGVPASPAIERFLRTVRPDVVLITPLIGVVASSQWDYLSTARRLRIPTGFCVCSWDNLSSKALVRELPDAVFVWNETQRDEAARFHRVPPDRIVVTGAQCYDQWFGRRPSRSRAEFCAHVRLPADRPYVLYVCSNMVWRSPPEAEFVIRWIRHLRSNSDPGLREAAILIRPNPTRMKEWDHIPICVRSSTSRVPGGIRWMPKPKRTTSTPSTTARLSSGSTPAPSSKPASSVVPCTRF
jgi:hypothetical protein